MQSSVKQQPSTRAVTPTTTVTPTTNTPTANMPTVTPVQAGPRQPTAMKPGGLIDATRLMIDLYHKTKRQAFLAMDKARAASSIFAEHTRGLACMLCPGPDLPTISQQPTRVPVWRRSAEAQTCGALLERAERKQTNNPTRPNLHPGPQWAH